MEHYSKRKGYKKTIGVDFDGVIHGYMDGWRNGEIYDEPVPGAIEALNKIYESGCNIVIYTVRKNHEDISDYIKRYNPKFEFTITNEKPYAEIYIDDRAVTFRGDWNDTLKEIETFKPWNKK